MKLLTAIIFTFLSVSAQAQDTCDCLQNLDSVIVKVTRNYAGYNDKVNKHTKDRYDRLIDSLQKLATTRNIDTNCYQLLKRYTNFFNDGHLGISLLKKRSKPTSGKDYATVKADPYLPSIVFPQNDWVVITLPSFSIEYNDTIYALFLRYKKELETRNNWILDIRGNDGGSRDCYEPLMPYLYTNPIIEYKAATWCSADNVKAARENFEDYKDQVDTLTKMGWQKSVEKMEANTGKWIYGTDDTIIYPAVFTHPAQIVILTDDGCASSAEVFILKAKQSRKVRLFGSHTNGTVDYGDVNYWDDLPYHPFNLRIATCRWNWIDAVGPIDPNGIQPDVIIPPGVKDWIAYTILNSRQ